jgi:UDP-N-acetylglucosamine--N-acetylmuramyl-(pentapeptide) pyrophosphoryl-undecaprenol N-acetylglucosamine transferase
MRFAFAAAGTGGHVYPALAVARALGRLGIERDGVVFFGGDRMECTTVPEAGYDFVRVPLQGLKRSMSKDNMRLPASVWKATGLIKAELARRRVDVLIAFGGYVTVPAGWAARRAGVRLFLHEQNAQPGLANRLLARRADTTFVSFRGPSERLRSSRLVGNPLRLEIASFDRAAARPAALRRYGIPDGVPVLGVLGGSLGAVVLNEAAARIADAHDAGSIAIVHLAGRAHADAYRERAAASSAIWEVVPFEDQMQYFYAASDVVLSRAGALTISELAATGTPSVVVPYEAGTAGHQAANAAHLVRAGGSVMLSEGELDQVPVVVEQLLADEPRREAMAEAAAKQGHPHAADVIAQTLLEAASG